MKMKNSWNYWKNIVVKNYKNFNFQNENHKRELENLKPIFIIGLPRSGSTITEAILSSANENITSLGEASIFNGIVARGFTDDKMSLIVLNIPGTFAVNNIQLNFCSFYIIY